MKEKVIGLAAEIYEYFTGGERTDGTIYIKLSGSAPGWGRDLMYAVHGGGEILPNDDVYRFTRDIVEELSLADPTTENDALEMYFEPDCYTGDLLTWAANCPHVEAYCADALDQFGNGINGLSDLLSKAQWLQMYEIAVRTIDFLENLEV
jgi:hypothetical protein